MKKKLLLMCAAGALVMATAVGGTLADFSTSTESKGVARITVNSLGIDMAADDGSGRLVLDTISAMPGGMVQLQEQNIVNNVEGGYALYTRVTINKKWTNPQLDGSKIRLYAASGETQTELVAGTVVNDWIVWHADEEQVILYYTQPLSEGESSTNIIDAIGFDAHMGNAYANAQVQIDFVADAVQTIAAADAIPSEWGVYPVIAEDGSIISIEE